MVECQILPSYVLLMTVNVTLVLIVMLGACLCCKKKPPKNDLLGLDGLVKLKNPDLIDSKINAVAAIEINSSSQSFSEVEKRSSTAAHRSLPDIPITDSNELYEKLKEKITHLEKDDDSSQTSTIKKQTSVSQHSSMSQADDVSSPYTRVKSSEHDYAKVRNTEHPYAQLNLITIGNNLQPVPTSSREIQPEAVHRVSSGNNENATVHNETTAQSDIPAASAIAGMISASQDLPYMTPPITSMHFSGDSQDSSKGYTSISVREPIANILAQQRLQAITKDPCDISDSHYATVSDDSDETYAAIDDANGRNAPEVPTDIYTSGSETYAQIQPPITNSFLVAVEINNITENRLQETSEINSSTVICPTNRNGGDHNSSVNIDSLRAHVHSRQASSSSNNSLSLANLGSPKPEKRQANSPLPPTPKNNATQTQLLTELNNLNVTSMRNSTISVFEIGSIQETEDKMHDFCSVSEKSPQKTPSDLNVLKDIDVMYAKVIKKNKNTRTSSSPNSSPIFDQHIEIKELNSLSGENHQKVSLNTQKTENNDSTSVDHNYETIPLSESSHQGCKRNEDKVLLHESLEHHLKGNCGSNQIAVNMEDMHLDEKRNFELLKPLYETLKSNYEIDPLIEKEVKSEYDPNYEVLKCVTELSDDGYAKVEEKNKIDDSESMSNGYSRLKPRERDKELEDYNTDANHNYESIIESISVPFVESINNIVSNEENDYYSNLTDESVLVECNKKSRTDEKLGSSNTSNPPFSLTNSFKEATTLQKNIGNSNTKPNSFAELESLNSEGDINYESLCYSSQEENFYEKLRTDIPSNTDKSIKSDEDDIKDSNSDALVQDFFQV